jgi:hypothetical protein
VHEPKDGQSAHAVAEIALSIETSIMDDEPE